MKQTIAVIFCTSHVSSVGREFEKIADCEVIEVAQAVKTALLETGYQVDLVDLDPVRIADLRKYDWVYNLAETIDGYPLVDYEVAEQMEKMGIHFTGSGSQTLKYCLNKAETKAELRQYGVNTPDYQVLSLGDAPKIACRFPVIVKPVHEDGSIGILSDSVAWNTYEILPLIERIHRLYHQPALVEEFIEGRDITVSILGCHEELVVLPPSEMTYPDANGEKFITFEAKWVTESIEFQNSVAICPCNLDPRVEIYMKEVALQVFRIMDCRDYARVDFRLQGVVPYVLEVNPNPCINPVDSAFIRSGKVNGFTYTEIVNRILESSFRNRSTIGEPVVYGRQINEEHLKKS